MERALAVAAEVCTGASCEMVDVDGGAVAGFVAAIGGFIAFFVLLGLLAFGFWLWMFIDTLKTEESEYKKIGSGERTLWIVLMIASLFFGFSFVMALIYYFVIYRNKKTPVKK